MARFSMLDIVVVRRDPDRVRRSARRRGLDPSFVDDFLRYDDGVPLRDHRGRSEPRPKRTVLTAEDRQGIRQSRCRARPATANRRAVEGRSQQSEERAHALSPERDRFAVARAARGNRRICSTTRYPTAATNGANVVVRTWGEPPAFDFAPKPHWELGEALGILDFERAAKLSGSRFRGAARPTARVSQRVARAVLPGPRRCRGYVEIAPPLLVSRATMWSTGQLSKFSDAMFRDPDADLFMIPTAEVPLTALHGDEILGAGELPLQYAAYTPCFRKEAGAAGKDTRGLIRQHQFEKVELVWLTEPETSLRRARDAYARRRDAAAECSISRIAWSRSVRGRHRF